MEGLKKAEDKLKQKMNEQHQLNIEAMKKDIESESESKLLTIQMEMKNEIDSLKEIINEKNNEFEALQKQIKDTLLGD